jgi:hypothetical protein
MAQIPPKESQDAEIAGVQVFGIETPLGLGVRPVGANQLLRCPPVVMPHDEIGFVTERSAINEPPVTEVVVLGHQEAGSLVEAS